MRTRQLALAAGALAVAALSAGTAPAAATPATTQWVLSSARLTGAGSPPVEWVTSLRIVNPGAVDASVDLTFLPQSPLDASDPGNHVAAGDNSAARAVRLVVGAGRTRAVDDVVGTLFGGAAPFGIAAGGIRVDSDVPVSVFSRTYAANARSATGVPGTYGISLPSAVRDEAIARADTGWLPFVAVSPEPSRGFRANLILLNAAGTPTVAHVKLVRGDGSLAGERDYTLAPAAAAQQGDVALSFGVDGSDENLTAVVSVKGGGPVFAGVTPIDNALGAPSFVAASKVFVPDDGAFGLLLDDGGYGFAGRLDVTAGAVEFLAATLVLDGCPQPSPVQTYLLQAFGSGAGKNTSFTRNADGTTGFSGSSSSASWSGTVRPGVDGTLSGSITYGRAAGSSGGACPGVAKTFPFQGARGMGRE